MKAGWQTIALQSLCEDVNVGHVGPSSMHRDSNGIPFLMGKNVGTGEIYTHNIERVTEAFHRSQPKSKLRPGDIVVVRIGKSGQAAKIPNGLGEANCSGLVVIKQPHGIHPDFLVYYLNSPIGRGYSLSQARGSTRLTLNTSSVAETPVPVPPLAEQQRIVGILDEAFDGIATATANAEQNLKNARALFESHLQSVFNQRGEGWEKKPLTAVCEAIFAGGDVPKGNSSKTETDKYRIPIFTNGEKNKGLYGYTNTARVTEPSLTISARGTIGYSEIRNESYYPAIRLIVVIPKKEILDLSFLYYAIESTDIGHSGTSIPQLTVPMVSGFTIPVPPMAVQQTIVERIDALREETQRLESLYQRKLAVLDELKNSLLHQAFSGVL